MLVRCGVCGRTKPEHENMAHKFDPGGQLIPVTEELKPKTISGIDIPLRLLLVDKGIITLEELTLKEVALHEQLAKSAHTHQRQDPQ